MELPPFQRPVLSFTELLHSQLHFYGPDAKQRERTELKRAAEGEELADRGILLTMMAVPPPISGSPSLGRWVTPLVCRHGHG